MKCTGLYACIISYLELFTHSYGISRVCAHNLLLCVSCGHSF